MYPDGKNQKGLNHLVQNKIQLLRTRAVVVAAEAMFYETWRLMKPFQIFLHSTIMDDVVFVSIFSMKIIPIFRMAGWDEWLE